MPTLDRLLQRVQPIVHERVGRDHVLERIGFTFAQVGIPA
jgi:hypothetical protein